MQSGEDTQAAAHRITLTAPDPGLRISRVIRSPVASILVLALVTIGSSREFAAAAPAGPKARLIRVDGDPVEGSFVRAGTKEIVLEGLAAPVDLSSVRELRFAPGDAPRVPIDGAVGLRVILRGGDVVRGALGAASAEELTIKPPDLGSLRIPFDAIRRVEAEPPNRGPCDEPGSERPARKGTDLVYSRSGDAFAGLLVEATMKGVVLEGNGTKQSLSWADLVVLHLDGTEPKERSGLVAEIETVGGSMLLGTDATGDADGWKVTLDSGLKVSVPKGGVTAVRWSGGTFARMETLPFEAKYVHYYTDVGQNPADYEAWWGARVDRTRGLGCPLRIANTTYRHGIAVHAKSIIKVPLGKAYSRFSSLFGIDDEEQTDGGGKASRGDVTARVLVDDKEVWTSKGSVKGGEPARTVGPVDVTGGLVLVLEVDFGGDMNIFDRADWADPILVRAP